MVLAVGATASAAYAWQQLRTNEAFLNAALKRATEIVDEAVAQAEKYNVPRNATLKLLGKAEGLFDDMAQYGSPTQELRRRKAWMLIQFARNYAILGDTGKQLARATEARRLLAGLAAEEPHEVDYQSDLATAHDEVGNVLKTRGDLQAALDSLREGLAIRTRVVATDPDNTDYQMRLSTSYVGIGQVLFQVGNLPDALQSFRDSLAIPSGWRRLTVRIRTVSASAPGPTSTSATCKWRKATFMTP
jgi:tetratricopeptide (TPR) repeat protein